MTYSCRFCQTPFDSFFIDLGYEPQSNSYLTLEKLELPKKNFTAIPDIKKWN